MKNKILDITVLSMLGAVLFAVQIALSVLPNIELVSLLVIIYSLFFGKKALVPIYIFVFLEGFYYGFSVWWICYLYIWTLLFVLVMIFSKVKSVIFWSVISACYGLFFGLLCEIPFLFIGGWSMAVAAWINGIPFDISHCAGNFIACLVLFKPLYIFFEKITAKMLTF